MLKLTSYTLTNIEPEPMRPENQADPTYNAYRYAFDAPGISAYEVYSLELPPLGDMEGFLIQPTLEVRGDKVIIEVQGVFGLLMRNDTGRKYSCEVRYFGIRDYRCFFNGIGDDSLIGKAAFFLEEAERSFDAGAYFSFLLMAGAVLESLLQGRLPGHDGRTLKRLIDLAETSNTLPQVAPYFRSKEEILDKWRSMADARNMLHPGLLDIGSIREKAMTCRAILDRTLKSSWGNGSAE